MTSKDHAALASFDFLAEVLAGYGSCDFAVRAWDGTVWEPDAGQPARITLVLQHPGAVRKMFWPPRRYTLGEAYISDDVDWSVRSPLILTRLAQFSLSLNRLPEAYSTRTRIHRVRMLAA